jgi:hypothetical protein
MGMVASKNKPIEPYPLELANKKHPIKLSQAEGKITN